jgi:hypothetical protein
MFMFYKAKKMASGIPDPLKICEKEFYSIILVRINLQNLEYHGKLFIAKLVLIERMLEREKNISNLVWVRGI